MKIKIFSTIALMAMFFGIGCATTSTTYVRKPVSAAALSTVREMTDAEAFATVRSPLEQCGQEIARQTEGQYGGSAQFALDKLNCEGFIGSITVSKFQGMNLTASLPMSTRFADVTELVLKQTGNGKTVAVVLAKEGKELWELPVAGTIEGERLISALSHLCPNLKR